MQINTKACRNNYRTALRVKVVIGTPSSVFQTLADPSLDVEAKNSESRLEQEKIKTFSNLEREEIFSDLL